LFTASVHADNLTNSSDHSSIATYIRMNLVTRSTYSVSVIVVLSCFMHDLATIKVNIWL